MPSIYKQVMPPSTVYISEAILWIALGRLPEVQYEIERDEARNYIAVESRRSKDILFNGVVLDFREPYSREEFNLVGQVIDIHEYNRKFDLAGWETHDEVLRPINTSIEQIINRLPEDPEILDAQRRFEEEKNIRAEAARWLRAVESCFDQVLDLSCAQLLPLLANGTLVAEGWHTLLDDEGFAIDAEMRRLPPASWTMRGFDFEWSRLETQNGTFDGVQIATEDLLRLFPSPLGTARPIEGKLFGNVIVIGNVSPEPLARRPRGRPQKAQASAAEVVGNLYASRYFSATDEKKEALIEEVRSFVKRAFGAEIGRSTVQNYLSRASTGMTNSQ